MGVDSRQISLEASPMLQVLDLISLACLDGFWLIDWLIESFIVALLSS